MKQQNDAVGSLAISQLLVKVFLGVLVGVDVAAICLASALYYLPYLLVMVAAAFMALILRIVQNVFRQACEMKDELDLTV